MAAKPTKPTWAVFDYGVGNLHSLAKALRAAGALVEVTREPAVLAAAGVAVLPGVGAFGPVMASLEPARRVLNERRDAGRPILGVCIGQQVLHDASMEAPDVPGLALVPGTVEHLPDSAGKVPHMGWNTLEFGPGDPIFAGVPPGAYVYFVHSYALPPGASTTATARYGTVFTAALRSGATVGFQFHPEKSSAVGQRILANTVAVLEELA